jgi:NAD-dependent dihydropyrimidine dehydrogenase PreA subunit
MPPVIDTENCAGCGTCEDSCPLDVIYLNEDGKAWVRYPEECWHCGSCRLECPQSCIAIRFPPRILLSAGVVPY